MSSQWNVVHEKERFDDLVEQPVAAIPAVLERMEESKEDVIYYRRKLKYIQSVGTMFRQRMGMLLKGHLHGSALVEFENVDNLYRQTLGMSPISHIASAHVAHQRQRENSVTSPEADVRSDVGVHPVEDPMMSVTEPRSRAESSHMFLTPRRESGIPITLTGQTPTRAAQDFAADDHVAHFWRDKFKSATETVERLQGDNDRLNHLLHKAGSSQREVDVRRAQHVCEVLKERNHLKQRNIALVEELRRLRGHLQAIDPSFHEVHNMIDISMEEGILLTNSAATEASNVGSGRIETPSYKVHRIAALEEDYEKTQSQAKTLQKHNALLQSRVKNGKEELSRQAESHAASMAEMQRHIETLVGTVAKLETEKECLTQHREKDQREVAVLQQELRSLREGWERAKLRIQTMEHDVAQHVKMQGAVESEAKREVQTLCATLEEREKRIVTLQDSFLQISNQLQERIRQLHDAMLENETMKVEAQGLRKQLDQFKIHFEERKLFTSVLAEVQGRMELSVEELRRGQRTEDLALAVNKMEHRVSGLTALEAQLLQKDDLIAMKDDEIQRMSMQLVAFEKNVNQISAVFLRFPRSVHDMEKLIVEHEEFGKAIGENSELQEAITIRLLQIQAKRNLDLRPQTGANDPLPPHPCGPLGPAPIEKVALLANVKQIEEDNKVPSNVFPPLHGDRKVYI